MESQIKGKSGPKIQSASEPSSFPMQNSALLTEELRILMNEIEKLREETKSIICNCSDPCCPFSVKSYEEKYPAKENEEKDHAEFEKEGKSPDFGFGSMETLYQRKCTIDKKFSLPHVIQMKLPSPLHHPQPNHLSTSLTNIPKGVQKRTDGTIVENDYPGFSCSTRKSKKKRRWMGSFSTVHSNCLDVVNMEVPPLADCQVDQDGVVSINEDYKFRREAPERKNLRSIIVPTSQLSVSLSKNASLT